MGVVKKPSVDEVKLRKNKNLKVFQRNSHNIKPIQERPYRGCSRMSPSLKSVTYILQC